MFLFLMISSVFLIKFFHFIFRRVFIYPKGNKVSVCQFIWNSGAASMPQRWEKFANFKFILINQLRHRRNIMEGIFHTYLSF